MAFFTRSAFSRLKFVSPFSPGLWWPALAMKTSVRPGLFGRLREVLRQRHHHGETARVVAGAVEPRIEMRVDDQHFAGVRAWNDGDGILAFQVRLVLGGKRDLRAHFDVLLRRAVQHVLEERAVASADVEARIAAVAVVVRVLVAGQTDQVEDAGSAALEQIA